MAVRPASDSDAQAIGEFINVCTLAFQGVARSSEHDAQRRLRMQGSDPEVDSFLIVVSDAIVGFAHLWRADEQEVCCFVRTHPEAAGRGIGAALLAACERRAEERFALDPSSNGPGRLTTTSWARDEAAPALLTGRGFSPVRFFVQMRMEAGEVEDLETEWPSGVSVRMFLSGDDDGPLYAAWRDAFAEHYGPESADEAAWWQERRDGKEPGAFDPDLWFLASERGKIIGFSLCERREALGRVAEIGVRKEARGRGVGFALLQHSLRALKGRGFSELVLDVDADNVTDAIALYKKAGMKPHPAFTIWERDVSV